MRGLGYFDILELPMEEVTEILEWASKRRHQEVKAAFGKKGK
jgi:hypothetical protein